jgi:hypothetical protein
VQLVRELRPLHQIHHEHQPILVHLRDIRYSI